MNRISKHITYKEATRSVTALRLGIENKPSEYELQNMELIAEKVFEPLREAVNGPIKINSFIEVKNLIKQLVEAVEVNIVKVELLISMTFMVMFLMLICITILKIISILTNLFGSLVQILTLIGYTLVM